VCQTAARQERRLNPNDRRAGPVDEQFEAGSGHAGDEIGVLDDLGVANGQDAPPGAVQ